MSLKWVSLLGMVAMIFFAWAISLDRRRFPWRAVWWGLGLQFAFAVLILRTSAGTVVFGAAQRGVDRLNQFANEGAKMVFGPLADPAALQQAFGKGSTFVFLVSISATIIVVSALSALLYHWGVLQRVVRGMAWVMRRAMGTSGSESLAAAANIFIGMTEAPLVIRPYLAGMTRSELLALMTSGMATIAGGVAIAYVSFGVNAGHLLAASVMSAPAALMLSKILLPETEPSATAGSGAVANPERMTVNSLDALCRGAGEGMTLAINVMAMLIAFVAMVALVNFLLGWVQEAFGAASPVTLQTLLGWLNAPFAWLMGVPTRDCLLAGQILGERIVLNEFIGYLNLTQKQGVLDARSTILLTYALCGFANIASIAIQIGGIGSLVPQRRAELARLGWRAMVGGLLASYLTATVVGILV